MTDDPSLSDKVVALHESLKEARIPHAIGGALALAYYAEPRVTIDIDLNLFVPADRWQDVVSAVAPLGIDTSEVDAEELLRSGQCRVWWRQHAVDFFFAYDPIHEEMRKQARRLPFGGETLPFLSPEHLAVCKAMFDRPKDWLDLEQMLIVTDGLDVAEIEEWLERMVGEDDLRLRRFRELRSA